MKNVLQMLIDEFQKEHDYLENQLKECINEWDFLGAKAFKESLIYTREKLIILKNLDNPNYSKIISLREGIKRIKKIETKDKLYKFSVERMKDRIPEYEKELSKLENKEKKFHLDSDELIICFESILAKEIKQFELEFPDKGIIFGISLKEMNLNIEIKSTDHNFLDYTTTKWDLIKLKRMGFQIADKNAIKLISEFQKTKILTTIELLSRIVYEVFRLYGDKEAKIKMKK